MPIITEQFLATYTGPYPVEAGDHEIKWEWRHRAHRSALPYCLIFSKKTRKFRANRFGIRSSGMKFRTLSQKDADKLRRMLPPAEIAACTAASIGARQ